MQCNTYSILLFNLLFSNASFFPPCTSCCIYFGSSWECYGPVEQNENMEPYLEASHGIGTSEISSMGGPSLRACVVALSLQKVRLTGQHSWARFGSWASDPGTASQFVAGSQIVAATAYTLHAAPAGRRPAGGFCWDLHTLHIERANECFSQVIYISRLFVDEFLS